MKSRLKNQVMKDVVRKKKFELHERQFDVSMSTLVLTLGFLALKAAARPRPWRVRFGMLQLLYQNRRLDPGAQADLVHF
jgi:hypothetical protein